MKDKLATYLGVPAAVLGVAAILAALISLAFVPRTTYSSDKQQTNAAIDSLRNDRTTLRVEMQQLRFDILQLKRIGCAGLTRDQKDIVGCP